jgi:hypothetical protein
MGPRGTEIAAHLLFLSATLHRTLEVRNLYFSQSQRVHLRKSYGVKVRQAGIGGIYLCTFYLSNSKLASTQCLLRNIKEINCGLLFSDWEDLLINVYLFPRTAILWGLCQKHAYSEKISRARSCFFGIFLCVYNCTQHIY